MKQTAATSLRIESLIVGLGSTNAVERLRCEYEIKAFNHEEIGALVHLIHNSP